MPSEKEMAAVLADVYETESVLSHTRALHSLTKEDKVSGYYRFVLEQHGLTKAQFDTAMGWYSANPVVLSDVYEEVIVILSKREAELKNEMNKEVEEQPVAAQLPNKQQLWSDTTSFILPTNPKDSLDNRVPFMVETDSLNKGILRLMASYTFKEGGFLDSAQMEMLACYADSTIDTLSYKIHKSFKKVDGTIAHAVPESKKLIRVEGFLFCHDTTKKSSVHIDDVKLVFIPKLESEELMLR